MPSESQKLMIIKYKDIDHHCHKRFPESAEEDHATCMSISSISNNQGHLFIIPHLTSLLDTGKLGKRYLTSFTGVSYIQTFDGSLYSSISLVFNRMEGPIDEHICALFQYTPFAPDGLFASADFCTLRWHVIIAMKTILASA
jgi:hypothetical protein